MKAHRAPPSKQIAQAFARHARAQLELLIASADSPRRSIRMQLERGITINDYSEDDLLAIALALAWAARMDRPARTKTQIAFMAAKLLAKISLWDATDYRPFISGSCWGPGGLASLLHRVPFIESLIIEKINALKSARAEIYALAASHGMEVRRCA